MFDGLIIAFCFYYHVEYFICIIFLSVCIYNFDLLKKLKINSYTKDCEFRLSSIKMIFYR